MADPQDGKQTPNQDKGDEHPGMFGDGTEEQNLNQKGDPSARITEADVKAAFKDEPADKA